MSEILELRALCVRFGFAVENNLEVHGKYVNTARHIPVQSTQNGENAAASLQFHAKHIEQNQLLSPNHATITKTPKKKDHKM